VVTALVTSTKLSYISSTVSTKSLNIQSANRRIFKRTTFFQYFLMSEYELKGPFCGIVCRISHMRPFFKLQKRSSAICKQIFVKIFEQKKVTDLVIYFKKSLQITATGARVTTNQRHDKYENDCKPVERDGV